MKTLLALCSCLLLAPSLAAAMPHGNQCLDPDRARGWEDDGRNALLVDAGRYYYRLEIAHACSSLSFSQVLRFRGDPITGRVCGNIGDAVITRDYPCRINSVQLLTKDEYKALMHERAQLRKERKLARKSRG